MRYYTICIPLKLSPFITNRTSCPIFLQSFELIIGIIKIAAVASLVAKRQNGNTRIVAYPVIHIEYAVYVFRIPLRAIAQSPVKAVTHTMALHICLTVDVKSEAVTQLVEETWLRIMAGAYGVDIVHTHQLEVAKHSLTCDIMAGELVVFMQVHSLEFHGLAIDEESVAQDFEAAEAHIETAPKSFGVQKQGIKLRGFGAPLPDSLYFSVILYLTIFRNKIISLAHYTASGIQQLE